MLTENEEGMSVIRIISSLAEQEVWRLELGGSGSCLVVGLACT
jgi:hypothetical protein